MNRCMLCTQEFFYDPKHHRCPGEWEAIAGKLEPLPQTTWVEECMEKQRS
jgi:hypothetical protein